VKLFLILCIIITLSAESSFNIRILVSTKGLDKIDRDDFRIAMELLIKNITKHDEFHSATVDYDDDIPHSIKSFNSGRYDALQINTLEYLHYFKDIESHSSQCWSLSKVPKKRLRDFYLLVREDSQINSFDDLIGKHIALTQLDAMQELYLTHLMLKTNNRISQECFSSFIYNKKGSTSILNLFFKKVDVAIVSRRSYNLAVELNPQLKTQLKILHHSREIFPATSVALVTNTNEALQKVYMKYAKDLTSDEFGKEVMSLFQSVENFNLTQKELKELYAYYQESQREVK
jgi:ABC-type phosphate/phosphonate transport system substrate-binding protein